MREVRQDWNGGCYFLANLKEGSNLVAVDIRMDSSCILEVEMVRIFDGCGESVNKTKSSGRYSVT